MNITVTFNTQLPTLTTNVPAPASEAIEKETKRVERRADRRLTQQKRKNAMYPKATDEQVADRWRIMLQEHNMLMIKRISNERVKSAADRDDLAEMLLLDLVGSRCNTVAAEAVSLLDTEDGSKGRGRAHHIIRNMARTRARSLITVRDREVSMDFTEVQQQAITASIKADGKWGKVDYDSASTINRELAKRSGDPLGFERSDMEFVRGSEKISEMEGGAINNKGNGYKQSIRIHKERSLVDMLNDTMRVGGLHDEGRMDRVDAKILIDWYQSFITMKPIAGNKRTQEFWSEVTQRAARLGTDEVRAACRLFLLLTPNAPMNDERLAMMDIVRGEVHSLGTLIVACTSATKERKTNKKKGDDQTDEYMLIRWTTVLRLLGFEATSAYRASMAKQAEHMALRAGATGYYDNLATYKCQLVRFPSIIPTLKVSVNKDAFRMANDGNRCGCNKMLWFDGTGSDYKTYRCDTCRTMVRCTSTYASREVDVLVQGRPAPMELRGARYGQVHDFLAILSGKQFGTEANQVIPFNKAKETFVEQVGAAAVDYYLVHGRWAYGMNGAGLGSARMCGQ